MAARPIAGPQQQQAVDASHPPLVVTVSSPSGDSEHPIGRPLLLLVTISNPRAANVRNRNANAQRARENLAKSGELEKMTAAAREAFDRTSTAVPEPTANVGSATDPYWSLITFEFVHESGDKVTPAVRPLATTKEMPGEIRLEGRGGAWMAFGVDSHLQTAIRPGRYEVRATLRTTGRGNMWLGVATSEPLAVRLAAASGDSSAAAENARDYQEGRFHLLDKQFERAKRLGERLLARVPGSVAAHELLGDANDGLGQLDDAERAFAAGIEAFQKHVAATATFLTPPDSDHPAYLFERLRAVRARQQKAR